MFFYEYNGKINPFILITIMEVHDTDHVPFLLSAAIFDLIKDNSESYGN